LKNIFSKLSISWRTSCGIGWTFIWIYAPNFIINDFLRFKIFLVKRPLPSGKVSSIIMWMHRWIIVII
jgi:hypothetical protein